MEKQHGLTTGSVPKQMIMFALPIFISNLFQQLYNAVDSLIVGNFLGAKALAAVGSSGSLIFLLTGFVHGVSLGAGVLIARYFGAKKIDRVKQGMRFGLICPMIMAVLIGIGVAGAAPLLIGSFSDDPEVIAYGVMQARTISGFFSLLAFDHCAAGILRGMGRPMVPMVIMMSIWCVLRILYITVTLRFIHHIRVIFFAYPITWSISAVIFVIYLIRTMKKLS